jgi:chromosomal replication initiation ATPase DnaA
MNTETLLKAIEDETGITLTQIQSKCRKEQFVYARRIIIRYMANKGHPTGQIAKLINRDHSTISNTKKSNEQEYRYNPRYRTTFDAITKRLCL